MSEENEAQIKAKIDSKAELLDPIDFSFKDLMNIEEINDAQPRHDKKKPPKLIDGKFASQSLKLGYNALKEINGLYQWCAFSFFNSENITSLDLSFNCFSSIPDEIMNFKGLKCLYLHGNKITNLAEIEKLKALKNLTTLSIHGNPIENLAAFKFYILARLPNLRHLNFSGISKADRQTALIWIKSNNKPLLAVETNDSKPKQKRNSDSDQD